MWNDSLDYFQSKTGHTPRCMTTTYTMISEVIYTFVDVSILLRLTKTTDGGKSQKLTDYGKFSNLITQQKQKPNKKASSQGWRGYS